MRSAKLVALAASISQALAVSQGFNYGAANSDGSVRYQADFQREFQLAKNLPGTSGFTSARLYTTIQGGSSTNEPIQAIPAAIAERTTLLLGLWASAGDGWFSAEIIALKAAIAQWGSSFTDLVVGISVGSEDLYRISPTGIAAKSGYGADPQTIARYVSQLREALRGTPLAGSPIGHVDTWTAWVNGSNQAVIDSVDWVGVNAFPYFQNTQSNAIGNGKSLYEAALADTRAAVGGKELWLTETGWPVSGKTENLAVPSSQNARQYWLDVGCPRFGKVNTWWYTLQDATPTVPNPSFGIVGANGQPVFDLSCDASSSSSTTSAGSSSTESASSSPSSTPSSQSSSASSAPSSSGSSAVSSAESSVASNPPASSGGGLSPSQGGGAVVIPPSLTQSSGVFPTGNISVTAGQPTTALTTQTTVVQGSGSSRSTSAPTSSNAPEIINAASPLSSSWIGAFVALFAAAMIL